MSKVKKYGWNLISILCTTILISMVVSKLLTGWSSIFSYRAFYVVSESMEPEITVNQLVLGKYVTEDDELEIGEIYAYKRDGVVGQEIIIHRLIDISEDGQYQFKGDNNEWPDTEPVKREDIGYQVIWY